MLAPSYAAYSFAKFMVERWRLDPRYVFPIAEVVDGMLDEVPPEMLVPPEMAN